MSYIVYVCCLCFVCYCCSFLLLLVVFHPFMSVTTTLITAVTILAGTAYIHLSTMRTLISKSVCFSVLATAIESSFSSMLSNRSFNTAIVIARL